MVGTTLAELLVACAVTLLVLGAALAVAVPAAAGFHAVPAHADVQQRLRVAVETLASEIRQASAGPAVDLPDGPADAWPAVLPCAWAVGPVAGHAWPCARADIVTLAVPDRPLWVLMREDADGAEPLAVARPPGCAPGLAGCQFDVADAVMVSDGRGAVEGTAVAAVGDGGATLWLTRPLQSTYAAGSLVASAGVRTYYLRMDAGAVGLQLRRRTAGSDLPVLDHLAAFSVEYFGAAAPPDTWADTAGRFRSRYGPAPAHSSAIQPDGSIRWEPVASCAFTVTEGAPRSVLQTLTTAEDGLARLPLDMLADGPWCPDAAAAQRVDLDLYRVRRIRVTVRLLTPSPSRRGAGSDWFAVAGEGRDAMRLVPDLQTRFDVSVRGGGR